MRISHHVTVDGERFGGGSSDVLSTDASVEVEPSRR
jgi:hypothetical protein